MSDLLEDYDGAPLPAELQREGRIWCAIREAAMLQPSGCTADDIADDACRALAQVLWPVLPSNDHNAYVEAIRSVPRRSGTPEWDVAASVGQAVGYDVGLATATDALHRVEL